jgi:predicted nucleic-acid-binding protein
MNKQFVDTNYILRYLLKDNLEQYSLVSKFFIECVTGGIKLVSNNVVLFELYWVLFNTMKLEKEQTCTLINHFLQLDIVEFEDKQIIALALQNDLANNLGLEDNYHLSWCKFNKISKIHTFDGKMNKVWTKIK